MSRTHGHHQMLFPLLRCFAFFLFGLQLLLVCGPFWSEKHSQWGWLTRPFKNIPLLCLKKLLGCFCHVIMYPYCKGLSYRFCSIWLKLQNLSRYFTTISSHIINKREWPVSVVTVRFNVHHVWKRMCGRVGSWAILFFLHTPLSLWFWYKPTLVSSVQRIMPF